jgi:hypothetical protein
MVNFEESVGQDTLRAEHVDKIVKGFALREFVMKQIVMTPKSSSWLETYYRETAQDLTALRGIPRLASFPQGIHTWEKFTAYMKKAGLESEIPIEDVLTNNVDVLARSLLRVSRGVVKIVDDAIYSALSAGAGTSLATAAEWSHATRGNRIPHEDIAEAASKLAEQNYKADTLLLSPKDYIYVITNDYVMDSFDASGPNLMQNGVMGKLFGLKVLVSNSVANDEALVLQSKICGTYRTVMPLTTSVTDDSGIKKTVRAWEIGSVFVTDPMAICKITNTSTT